MYKIRTIPFVLLMILLASCAPILATPSPAPASPNATPVVSMAVVQSVEVQIMEVEPLQANAIILGQLPDGGCTTISSMDQVRNGNTFNLTLLTTITVYVRDRLPDDQDPQVVNEIFDTNSDELAGRCKNLERPKWLSKEAKTIKVSLESFPYKVS